MLIALAWKELRETALVGVLGLLVMLYFMTGEMEYRFDPYVLGFVSYRVLRPHEFHPIPFVNDSFTYHLGWCGALLALLLGIGQTVGETWRRTWLFLLHRPIDRRLVFAVKLLVGTAVLLLATGIPSLTYALWAATPGNHASPFEWAMTIHAWQLILATLALYLAAFQVGLRPARWYATRALPVACGAFVMFVVGVGFGWTLFGWLIPALAVVLLLITIFSEAAERDHA